MSNTVAAGTTPVDPVKDYEKVKLLFDCTKYHLSVYTTIGTILVGLLGLIHNNTLSFNSHILLFSIMFIAVAGWSGGIIASTLPECDSLEQFLGIIALTPLARRVESIR
jgi:hypothetical protein